MLVPVDALGGPGLMLHEEQLVFVLIAVDRPWSIALYPSHRPPHFALFVPDGEESRELNYGQGEGQFTIRGREWGVYTDAGGISLVAHDRAVTTREAIEVVEAVCAKLERIGGARIAYRIRTERYPTPSIERGA